MPAGTLECPDSPSKNTAIGQIQNASRSDSRSKIGFALGTRDRCLPSQEIQKEVCPERIVRDSRAGSLPSFDQPYFEPDSERSILSKRMRMLRRGFSLVRQSMFQGSRSTLVQAGHPSLWNSIPAQNGDAALDYARLRMIPG